MILRLSHRLDERQPNWPGAPGLVRRPNHAIDQGDIANTHVVEIYSHYGTHCDVPYHFLPHGKTLSDFDVNDFVFDAPVVVDIPLDDNEVLHAQHLEPHAPRIAEADLLLIRSGFQEHRSDVDRYQSRGPGFSEQAAAFLREVNPQLRGVAIDWLSLCALAHVEEGTQAHRTLLSERDDTCTLIFEDVDIAALGERIPLRVLALPLFIDGLDGSPCTIIAEVT